MKYLLKCLAVRQQYLVLHATSIVLWKQLFNNIVQELKPPEVTFLDVNNLSYSIDDYNHSYVTLLMSKSQIFLWD